MNEDLRSRQWKNIYVLTGNDDFLKRSYKNRLKEGILGEDTMNYACFEGKETQVQDLISIGETLPFLAPWRCIVAENTGFFKSSPEPLLKFFDRMPPTTVLIFVEAEVDERGKAYKRMKDKGYKALLNHPNRRELSAWAAGMLARYQKKITPSVMEFFLDQVGEDMERLKGEIEKLEAYLGDREVVELEDIGAITTRSLKDRVFDMISAVSMNRMKEAFSLYEELLALQKDPMGILYLITRQYNQLYQVKEMTLEGMSREAIAKEMKLHSFVVSKLISQAGRYDKHRILGFLNRSLKLEEAVKQGRLQGNMALELLILSQ